MVVQMLRTAVTLKWSEHKSKRSGKKNLFGCARLILLCGKMFVFLSLTWANCSTNSKCLPPPPQRPTAASPLQTPSTNKQPQLDEVRPIWPAGFYATKTPNTHQFNCGQIFLLLLSVCLYTLISVCCKNGIRSINLLVWLIRCDLPPNSSKAPRSGSKLRSVVEKVSCHHLTSCGSKPQNIWLLYKLCFSSQIRFSFVTKRAWLEFICMNPP